MNLIERAQQWVDHDPDPVTAEELGSLVQAAREGDQDAELELARAMNGPLQFGTAGLRGEIGAVARITTARFIRDSPAPISPRRPAVPNCKGPFMARASRYRWPAW